MAYCDDCGAQYLRASSKWCSECGASKETEVQEVREEVVANVTSNDLQGIAKDSPIPHLWYLPQFPNATLYDRVYGQRLKGLPRGTSWGKSFLKQHHCYKKQHKKLLKNQEIVQSWFMPGKNEFVDSFLKSPSLRWNLDFLKKLRTYCRTMRKFGDIDERIVDITFPDDGTKLCWRGSDILKYAFEIKHYRKSSKSIPRCAKLVTEELSPQTLAIMPPSTSSVSMEEGASSMEALPLVPVNQNLQGRGTSSLEGLPFSPVNPNLQRILQGEGTSREKKPRKRRLPARFKDF